jgi:hypothetical protein
LKLANQLSSPPDGYKADVAEQLLHGNCSKSDDHKASSDVKDWLRHLEDAGNVTDLGITAIVHGVDAYRSIAGHLGLRDSYLTSNTCLVAADASMERDFTTNGVAGGLRCPFAKLNGDNHAPPQVEDGKPETCAKDDLLDPIKAEFHCGAQSARSVSERSKTARCPIRYLDNHSPEEVAQYFENHKHEIPRSHALCIKRYQADGQTRRMLDEKYKDTVQMLKGLGKHHQPYLHAPSIPDVGQLPDPSSAARVEEWAEEVHAKSPEGDEMHPPDEAGEVKVEGYDDRVNQFDRSLRDVRVGESPSRPWGIHVPVPSSMPPEAAAPVTANGDPSQPWTEQDVESALHVPPVIEHVDNSRSSRRPADAPRCPFHKPDQTWTADVSSATERRTFPKVGSPPKIDTASISLPDADGEGISTPNPFNSPPRGQSPRPAQPNMVFNGPVFFGYSPEATAALLERLGGSRKT